MALLPSGLGWSAEENYMKQYSGVIAKLNYISGGEPLPVISSLGDLANGYYIGTLTGGPHPRAYYIAADTEGCVVGFNHTTSGSLDKYTISGVSTNSNARIAFGYFNTDGQGTDSQDWYTLSLISGTVFYVTNRLINFTIGNRTFTSNPEITWKSGSFDINDYSAVSSNIEKSVDGYCAIAFVKYKTHSDITSNTPVLISSVDDYTFFSGAHNETFAALYNGKRFYFSFSYATDEATPYGILTLDYTGSSYPVMSPALLFEYVARSVALTVTETGDPWGDTPSEPGGGDGNPDTGDDVPFSTPPSSSAVASGFVTLFTPDLTTLNAVAAYMWSSSFDIDQIKKIFANPIDAILGLHIVPCAITPAGQKEIKVAGFGTGQYSGYTTNQYVTVSCGSVAIPKKWGSYLDYSPYTKTQIWLPFIGFREIDIDDIQGKTISLQYVIDILSGACVAEVLVPCDDGTTSVLYSFTGSCAAEIPITAADMRGAVSAALSIAGSAVAAAATVASGGATAPMAAGVIASTAVNSMALKPTIQRSGTASGAAGYLTQRIPYIVREQPNIALPAEQNKLTGYPSFVTVSLNTLSGYNEIAHIHLENVPGTDAEISEIENLLHSGVIF